ncbi:hypothetical protein O1L60_04030 [Streptomyces diastatochromogenes]|nr:hypothetical protein [Streptomyces diastatochromogenes]
MHASRRAAATVAATTLATSSLIWAPAAFANAPEIPRAPSRSPRRIRTASCSPAPRSPSSTRSTAPRP